MENGNNSKQSLKDYEFEASQLGYLLENLSNMTQSAVMESEQRLPEPCWDFRKPESQIHRQAEQANLEKQKAESTTRLWPTQLGSPWDAPSASALHTFPRSRPLLCESSMGRPRAASCGCSLNRRAAPPTRPGPVPHGTLRRALQAEERCNDFEAENATLHAENSRLQLELATAHIQLSALQAHLESLCDHTREFLLAQMETLHVPRDALGR
ncbi:uncharacterized protein LOC133352597 [Lethenteron reissneri]|uniref:uncharacterized protein LOC133352597 n=1 Tax=Lethenteron reissneri TaxID=7753 RepID=UPI002AB6DB6F|nr:uncharacterized protein LOC133352597 [Lethenteron reissneri]